MGIMGMISNKKAALKKTIQARQDKVYLARVEKLEQAQRERAEMEKRHYVKQELKKEQAKMREMKYGGIKRGLGKVVKGIGEAGPSKKRKKVKFGKKESNFTENNNVFGGSL